MSNEIPPFGQAPLVGYGPAHMSQEALWIAVAESVGCEVSDIHDWVLVVETKAAGGGVHGKIVTSGPDRDREAFAILREAAANMATVLRR